MSDLTYTPWAPSFSKAVHEKNDIIWYGDKKRRGRRIFFPRKCHSHGLRKYFEKNWKEKQLRIWKIPGLKPFTAEKPDSLTKKRQLGRTYWAVHVHVTCTCKCTCLLHVHVTNTYFWRFLSQDQV